MATKNLKKGLFITFEGPEGSGKSTHARKIYTFLQHEGYDVVFTREPGGTIIGERIRDVLLNMKTRTMSPATELLLFEACRSEIIREIIKPALDKKAIVISDRFNDSTIVYQGYTGALPLKNVIKIDSMVTKHANPDLTILLDIDAAKGLKRATKNNKIDRMESKPLSFHKKVRNGFMALARKNKKRIKLIKTKEDMRATEKAVKKEILKLVEKYAAK